MKAILCAVSLLTLAGCGPSLSNRMFEEDALFRAAVPSVADLETAAPEASGSEARDPGELATTVVIARDVSVAINSLVWYLLGTVDYVIALPVTTRDEDLRVWGPYDLGEHGVGSVRVAVDRVAEGEFDYVVQMQSAAPEAVNEDAWQVVLAGHFDGADATQGEGVFSYDAGAATQFVPADETVGVLYAEHARQEGGQRVKAWIDGWSDGSDEPRDTGYFFAAPAEGGGLFEYYTTYASGQGPAGAGQAVLHTRWLPGRAGRSDGVLFGGELGTQSIPFSECFDTQLRRTFYFVDLPGEVDDIVEGDPSECPFAWEGLQELGLSE